MSKRKSPRRRVASLPLAPLTSRLTEAYPARSASALNSLSWIFEALEAESGYASRRMFGCYAAYLDGLIYLVTAAKREPWNGLLVCTTRDRHASLCAQWPALQPHRVLGKWLYVSQDHPEFEAVTGQLIQATRARDPRLGVLPKTKTRSERKSSLPRRKR